MGTFTTPPSDGSSAAIIQEVIAKHSARAMAAGDPAQTESPLPADSDAQMTTGQPFSLADFRTVTAKQEAAPRTVVKVRATPKRDPRPLGPLGFTGVRDVRPGNLSPGQIWGGRKRPLQTPTSFSANVAPWTFVLDPKRKAPFRTPTFTPAFIFGRHRVHEAGGLEHGAVPVSTEH